MRRSRTYRYKSVVSFRRIGMEDLQTTYTFEERWKLQKRNVGSGVV